MKKFWITMICAILIFCTYSCNKQLPPEPAYPTSTPNVTQTVEVAATQTEIAVLVSIPGGTFIQSGGTSFTHTISSFMMGKYEMTYELWYTVYQWAIRGGYVFANAGVEGNDGVAGLVPTLKKYKPVTTINWRDIIVWCNAYSQKEGLTPVYCSDAGFTTPIKISSNLTGINTTAGSYDNPYVNWNANGFRLPTEGEWQYAARYKDGASWTPYNYASGATSDYSNVAATSAVAWYDENCSSMQTVGTKTMNALGVYDMSGNAAEWCWDWFDSYPATSTDYRGPTSGSYRVLRGGCFNDYKYNMMSGIRYLNLTPDSMNNCIGFRVAKSN